MEPVLINDIEVLATPFDDINILVKKFCIASPQLIDKRFVTIDCQYLIQYPITENSSFIIKTINETYSDELSSFESYYEVYKKNVADLYQISFTDFILYKMLINPQQNVFYDNIFLQKLRNIDNVTFGSKFLVLQAVDKIKQDIEQNKNKYKLIVKDWNFQVNLLTKNQPVPIDKFIEEGKTYKLELDKKYNLFKVFETLTLSNNIPFAVFSNNGKPVYNIYMQFKSHCLQEDFPPDAWLKQPDDNLCIILYLLIDNSLNKFVKILIYEDSIQYEDKSDERITITNDEIYENLFKCVSTNSKAEIKQTSVVDTKIFKIRGDFVIPDLKINRTVFLHLILNNPTARFFLFCDEEILDKHRFFIKMMKSGEYAEDTLTLLITQQPASVKVRLNNIQSSSIIELSKYLLSYLIGLYLDSFDSISGFYKSLGFEIFDDIFDENDEEFEDTKRYKKLVMFDPVMFQKPYTVACLKDKQPYVVQGRNKQEVLQRVEALKEKIGDEQKIMEYPIGSGIYYACEPRDENDGNQSNIYIGLKQFIATETEEEVIAPCCFKSAKSAKEYYDKYINQSSKQTQDTSNYVKEHNTLAPLNRYSSVPYVFMQLFDLYNIPIIKTQKKQTYSILRMGVEDTTSSIIDCLMTATIETHSLLPSPERISAVEQKRKEMLKEKKYETMISQESFNYNLSEKNEKIFNLKEELDPRLFFRQFEVMFDVNIIMSAIDEKHPQGTILYPYHSKIYLRHPYKIDKPFVFINVFYKKNYSRTFQCELYKDTVKDTCLFSYSDTLTKIFMDIETNCNNIHCFIPQVDNSYTSKMYAF